MFNNKRKLIGFIIGLIFFSMTVTSLTYAYYAWQSANSNITFNLDDSSFYCETDINSGVSNLSPVLDYKNGVLHKFKVNNIANKDTTFSITMNIESIDDALKHESFKYKLMVDKSNGNNDCSTGASGCEEVASGNFKDVHIGNNTLVPSIELLNNSRYEYYFFMYIDGNMNNPTEMQTASMVSTLGVCDIYVTFDTSVGDTTVTPMYKKIIEGEKYGTLPTPTRNNAVVTYNTNGGNTIENDTVSFTFNGWFKEQAFTNAVTSDTTVTSTVNHTLYPKWTKSKTITLPSPTKEGYTFNGWYSDSEFNNKVGDAGDAYNPEKSITLYAKFTPNSYTIHYVTNNNSCSLNTTTYANKNVNFNEVVNIANPTCTGYTFNGWSSSTNDGLGSSALTGTTNNPSTSWNGSNTKNTYFKNLRNTSGDVTLTAVWTTHTYTVNFYSNSLPSGYKAVEYIESTGTQYINTEYYPSQNTGIYTDFQFTDLTTVQRVYGVDHDSSTANISYSFYINKSSKWAYAYKDGVGNWVSTNINVDKNRHIWDFNTTSRKVTLDSTLYNSNVSGTITKTSIYPLYVMATNWDNSLQFRAKLKLYKFNIYENGIIVRKYIPCYRVSDNEAGLYDVINGIFYTNAGTGEFTVGDDLTNYDLLGTQSFTYGVSQNLNENTFDREGYTFTGWNTKANGSGTSYEDKQSVSNLTSEDNGVVNLYAQWDINNYTVHYVSSNNNCSLNATTYANKTVDYEEVINIANPTCTGYTFSGWSSSSSNGLGSSALTGTSSTLNTSWNGSNTKNTYFKHLRNTSGTVTLTAVWTPHTYTVNYYKNSLPNEYLEIDYVETTGTQWIDTGVIPNNNTIMQFKFRSLQTTGDVILGYSTGNDNTDYRFFNYESRLYFDIPTNKRLVGSSCNVGTDYNLEFGNYYVKNLDTDTVLLTGTANNSFTGTNSITIANYSNSSNSKVRVYNLKIFESGALIRDFVPAIRKNDEKPGLYDIVNGVFYLNNGSGTLITGNISQSFTYGVSQNLTANTFEREGYTFTGWNTKANGSGTSYEDKQSVSNLTSEDNGVVNLYAQWESNNYTVHFASNNNNCPLNAITYGDKTIDYENVINIANPSCTGYTFNGWSSSTSAGLGDGALTGTNISLNTSWDGSNTKNTHFKHLRNTSGTVTLTAVWTAHTYTVNYYSQGFPKDYQRVKYIKSSGTQYILTNIKANNETGVYARIKSNVTNADKVFFGATSPMFAFGNNGNSFYFGWGNWTASGSRPAISNSNINDIYMNYLNDRKAVFNTTTVHSDVSSLSGNSNPLMVFAYNNGGTAQYHSSIELYELVISQGTDIVANLIPCYRISDSVIGLYDLVNGKFYTNAGTGTFTKGEDISYASLSYNLTNTQSFTYGVSQNLIENTFDREGYTFTGWNTKANGSGTSYEDKQSVINLTSEDNGVVNLYAQWESNNYTVHYTSNNNSCSLNSTTYANKTVDYEEVINIANPTCTGYTFSGWSSSSSNGLGSSALTGTSSTLNTSWNGSNTKNTHFKHLRSTSGTVTLTAVWTANTYTVNYYSNSLSSGYKAIEYIESTGTQYIDTGITPDATTDIEVTFKTPSDSAFTYQRIFGQINSAGNNRYQIEMSNNNISTWTLGIGGTTKTISMNATSSFKTFKFVSGEGAYVDGTLVNSFTNTETNSYNIWLFRGYDKYSAIQISSAKIWKNGSLVRNFVPCYRVSDDDVGLYDIVTGTFYTNAGTGNFSYDSEFFISQSFTYGVSQNLTANTFDREGYTFTGWNTKANGSGTSYDDKQSVINLTSEDNGVVNLYAQWDVNNYTVHYASNNNNCSLNATTYANKTVDYEEVINIANPTCTGYTFSGWSSSSSNGLGSGALTGTSSSSINVGWNGNNTKNAYFKHLTTSGTVTLTAVWTANTYTVSYDYHSSKKSTSLVSEYDGYYNMGNSNSLTTTTWKDLKGNNNGTIENGTWGSNYLSFNGTNSGVKLGEINSDYYTLELTFLLESRDGQTHIMGNWEQGGGGLSIDANGKLVGQFRINGSSKKVTSSQTLSLNTVYNAAVTYDGSAIKLYLDGVLLGTTNAPGGITAPASGTPMALGGEPKPTGWDYQKFKGKIYYAAIYDTALNQAEIQSDVKKVVTYKSTYGSLQDNNIGITYFSGWYDAPTNGNEITSSSIVNKTNNHTLYAYGAKSILREGTSGDATTSFLGTNINKGEIESITFANSISGHTVDNDTVFDVGIIQNRTVLLWYEDSDNDELYEVYIGSNGGVYAPPNSSYLFANLGSLQEFNNINYLNTSNVINMSYMFRGESVITSLDLSNFNTSNVTTMQAMFDGCNKLVNLNLNGFNTSNVTNMQNLFYGCSGLTSLNLSSFNTSNVTNMSGMFSNCRNLISLDLSSFNTSVVTDMNYMFTGDGNLKTIYVTNSLWSTGNVTRSTQMFKDCGNLVGGNGTTYNASYQDKTRAVIDTDETPGYLTEKLEGNYLQVGNDGGATTNFLSTGILKGEIEKITFTDSISGHTVNNTDCWDVSIFKNGSVLAWSTDTDGDGYYEITIGQSDGVVASPNASYLFANLNNLEEMSGMSNFDTSNVVSMKYMFSGDSKLSTLDLSSFDTSKVTDMNHMFYNCSVLTSLNVSSFNTSKVTNMQSMFQNCNKLVSLDLSNFDTSKVILMDSMFNSCSSLTSLNVSSFDTSNVTAMNHMFNGCKLTNLDLSNFETSKVTNMSSMFNYCNSLTSLDLSSFNTSNVTNMSYMFNANNKLNIIYVSSNLWSTSNVTNSGNMFNGCNNLVGGNGTIYDASYKDAIRAVIDTSETPGYLTEKIEGDFLQPGSDGGTTTNFLSTSILKGEIEKITFTDSISGHTVNNTDCWDVSLNKNNSVLAWSTDSDSDGYYEITIGQDNGVVALGSTSYLFAYLNNLEAIDNITNFNTSKVSSMKYMFYGDSSLTALNLSSFDTSKVGDMQSMFYGTSSLTNLDVSSFNTEKVTSMYEMFRGASSLTNLNLSSFTAPNVATMQGMFRGCTNLSNITFNNNLNSSKLKAMNDMFNGCTNLLTVNMNGFVTNSVTSMASMFSGCQKIEELDLSSFYTPLLESSTSMFQGCYALRHVNVSNMDTSNVTNMTSMFVGDSALEYLNLSSFDVSSVKTIQFMFRHCNNLLSIYVSPTLWNFASVTTGHEVFYYNGGGCITNITGGNGYMRNNSTISYVHARIDTDDTPGYLTAVPTVNSLEPGSVKDNTAKYLSTDIIKNKIKKITFTNSISGRIANDTDCWDVSFQKNGSVLAWVGSPDSNGLYEMTIGQNGGVHVLNGFGLFSYLNNLVSIDGMQYLDVSDVTLMRSMFDGCTSLTSLNLSSWNTSKVKLMNYMFRNCTSLTSLNLGTFDTSNVINMEYMFYGCTGLTTLNVSNFNTAKVKDMQYMFYNCSSITSLSLNSFSTTNVTNMQYMFYNCSSITTLDLNSFNTLNVTRMDYMFYNCTGLTSLSLDNFNTSKVTNMQYMFTSCSNLTSLNLSSFDTTNVTSMVRMFMYCSNLTSLNLNSFYTNSLISMSAMFWGCTNLTTLNMDNFDTSKVTSLTDLFRGCGKLVTLNLTSFETSLVTDMSEMFGSCSSLTTIYVDGSKWKTTSVSNSGNMFSGCSRIVGGNGTTYNSSYRDKTYARIDVPNTPGYLTQGP